MRFYCDFPLQVNVNNARLSRMNSIQPAKAIDQSPTNFQDIEVSGRKQLEIILESLGETLIDFIPIASNLMNFVRKEEEKLNAVRMAAFLEQLSGKMASQEDFKRSLIKLLTSNTGLVLFQKTVRVLNRDNFEKEFIKLLANSLAKITNVDVEKMFEKLNYVLSQIEKLSAQALILLSKYQSWKGFPLQRATGMGSGIICPDWDTQVASHFVRQTHLLDAGMLERVTHVFHELESNGMIHNETSTKSVELTEIGREVYEQISC